MLTDAYLSSRGGGARLLNSSENDTANYSIPPSPSIGKRILDAKSLSRRHHRISIGDGIAHVRSASVHQLLIACASRQRALLLRARCVRHTFAIVSQKARGKVQTRFGEVKRRGREDEAEKGDL